MMSPKKPPMSRKRRGQLTGLAIGPGLLSLIFCRFFLDFARIFLKQVFSLILVGCWMFEKLKTFLITFVF
jgi:hypothetical protein